MLPPKLEPIGGISRTTPQDIDIRLMNDQIKKFESRMTEVEEWQKQRTPDLKPLGQDAAFVIPGPPAPMPPAHAPGSARFMRSHTKSPSQKRLTEIDGGSLKKTQKPKKKQKRKKTHKRKKTQKRRYSRKTSSKK